MPLTGNNILKSCNSVTSYASSLLFIPHHFLHFIHKLIKCSFSFQTWETQFRTFYITVLKFLRLQSVTYNYLPIQKALTNIKLKVIYIHLIGTPSE